MLEVQASIVIPSRLHRLRHLYIYFYIFVEFLFSLIVVSNRFFNRFIRSSKMRSSVLLAVALPLVQGIRIVQSNDDGWSEANLRTLFNVLDDAGHDVVLSAPAENKSGSGNYS